MQSNINSKKLFNDIREKYIMCGHYRGNSVVTIYDANSKRYDVVKNIEVAWHNVGIEKMRKIWVNKEIETYVRVFYFLIYKNMTKIEYINKKGKKESKYFISPTIFSFNIKNGLICKCLGICMSSLNEAFTKIEQYKVLGRYTEQEDVDGCTRKMAMDPFIIQSLMCDENNDVKSFREALKYKKKNLQLKKILIKGFFTIVKAGFSRSSKSFQQFIKNQNERLNLPFDYFDFGSGTINPEYEYDPGTGEFKKKIEPNIEKAKVIDEFINDVSEDRKNLEKENCKDKPEWLDAWYKKINDIQFE